MVKFHERLEQLAREDEAPKPLFDAYNFSWAELYRRKLSQDHSAIFEQMTLIEDRVKSFVSKEGIPKLILSAQFSLFLSPSPQEERICCYFLGRSGANYYTSWSLSCIARRNDWLLNQYAVHCGQEHRIWRRSQVTTKT